MSQSETNDPSLTMYDKVPGSTMISQEISAPQVRTGKIKFTDGSEATSVSQDYKENKYNKVPSSYALYQGLMRLQENLNQIDPNDNFFRDNTTVTLPLIDPHFSQVEEVPWVIKGWIIVDGYATYSGVGNNENYLRIPTNVFTFPSYYHLNVVVKRLDSGVIRIYDNVNTVVLEISRIGEHNVEMYVANPDVMTLRIVAEDTYTDDVVQIESVNLHLVTDRLRDYLITIIKSENLVVGISEEEAIKIATDIANAIIGAPSAQLGELEKMLAEHLSATNPHGITCKLIGAATADHTHSEFTGISGDLDLMLKHVQTTSGNPHGVTCAEIGAAEQNHTHTPEEIGAADRTHVHNEYALTSTVDTNKTELTNRMDSLALELASLQNKVLGNNEIYVVTSNPSGIQHPYQSDNAPDTPLIAGMVNYILHESETNYDYYDGYARSTKACVAGSNAAMAFSSYHGVGAMFDCAVSAQDPCILSYKFHLKRNLLGFTLYKAKSDVHTGFVSDMHMSFIDDEGTVVDKSFLNAAWSTNAQGTSDDSIEVRFDNDGIDAQEIRLTINAVVGNKWGILFVPIFGDMTNVEEIEKPYALVLSGRITLSTPNTAAGSAHGLYAIARPTPEENIPLWVLYTMSGGSGSLVTSPCTPVFSKSSIGVSMFIDKYNTGNTSNIFGEISSDDELVSYPARNIYSSDNTKYFKSSGSSLVTIKHTATSNFVFPSINALEFSWASDLVTNNLVPQSIRVTANDSAASGGVVLVDDDDVEYYLPDGDVDGGIYKLRYLTENVSVENITELKIEFNYKGNRVNQTAVGLTRLDVYMKAYWYDPATKQSNDLDSMVLGRLEHVSLPETSRLKTAMRLVGVPTGTTMCIPVNHYNKITQPDVYRIPNPYCSTSVSARIVYDDVDNAEILDSSPMNVVMAADIVSITATDIFVYVKWPGRYAVKVVREW